MGQLQGLDAPAQLQPTFDFPGTGGFQPQLGRFRQHGVRLLPGLALTGNAQFRTLGDIPAFLPLNDRRERRKFDHFTVFVDPPYVHVEDTL